MDLLLDVHGAEANEQQCGCPTPTPNFATIKQTLKPAHPDNRPLRLAARSAEMRPQTNLRTNGRYVLL